MRIVNTDPGTTVLSHEGVVYEAVNGVFDVPEHVGQALIGFPHWLREHEAADRAAAEKAATDTDPEQLAARVAALEAENATLKASAAADPPASKTRGTKKAASPKPPA